MGSVLSWIRRLGNLGAVANAGVLANERTTEDWMVSSLVVRLDALLGSPGQAVHPVSDRPASAA